MTLIYKIFRATEFAEFIANGETLGAPIDIEDGYVHMSTGNQVAVTASKYFMGEDGLKLLGLDADTLGDDLRWEPSRGGALFPHLYRKLSVDDVLFVHDLPFEDGSHRFDGLLT